MFGIPLHKLIIHFPIALTIMALIYDSWAAYSKKPEFHEAGYGLTLWAAVAALVAIVTGLQLAGVTRIESGVVTGHAGFGIGSGIIVTALAVVRYSAHAREQRGYRMSWLVLEIGGAALIVATAITGHRL
jgi:uncharacterized membrane protein